MKWILRFIGLMLLACFSAPAQTLTILDDDTKTGLELVTLLSDEPRASAVTNSKGQTEIAAFRGAARIEIRSLGFKTVHKNYAELVELGLIISLKSGFMEMDEVVVSATRWNQSARRVPGRISSISPAQVALLNPQTTADLLGATGEVFIQKSQQGGGSPMIRGFAANRLLYAVDGVRMNTAIFRSGNLQQVISIDAFSLEHTEVLFGPGSVMYGSDAVGGVMSFQTLQPQLSYDDSLLTNGNATARYSSANQESTQHFDLSLGWKKWASVTSFTHSGFGNLRMGKNGPSEYLKPFTVIRQDSADLVQQNTDSRVQDPSGYSQINLMQKLRYKPSQHLDLQFGFHYSETSDYSRYDRMIERQPNGMPVFAVWNYGPQIWMMNLLNLTYQKRNFFSDRLSLRLAHQSFEESRIDRRFNANRLRTQHEQVTAYSLNLDLEKNSGRHRFYYGVEYVFNEVKSRGSARNVLTAAPIPVAERYPESTWSSYAAYANYQFSLSKALLIQSGVRFSSFELNADFSRNLRFYPFDFRSSSLSNSATTGSLGLVWTPDPSWKISLNGSSGFRAPNVDDIGKIFEFGAAEVVVPNPSLTAEYAWNTEINVAKRIGERLRLDLTGYYTFLDRAMVRRPFLGGGQDSILFDGEISQVFAIQNAAFVQVVGFLVGVDISLPEGFSISSRYNFQQGIEEMEDGSRSPSRHAAPAFGMTRLSYQHERVQLQFYAQYSAGVSFDRLNAEERLKPEIYAIDEQGRPFSPGWYTLNLKALVKLTNSLTVTAGLENLTDQRYRPYSSGLVAAGRNVVLALRAGF